LERAKRKQAEDEEKQRKEEARKKAEEEEKKREQERRKQEEELRKRKEEEERRRKEEEERLKREEEERERREAEEARKAAAANVQCGDDHMAEARQRLETEVSPAVSVACRHVACTGGSDVSDMRRTLMAPEKRGRRQPIAMSRAAQTGMTS
jgi:hypothetical protein